MERKKIGEAFLCLDEFFELTELVERDTTFQPISLLNNSQESVGVVWEHLGHKITIVQPEELEDERLLFEGLENDVLDNLEWNSSKLARKLFVPWELHLPVYIIVETEDDNFVDDKITSAWLSSFTRIIMEELAESIGGWTPADKMLRFDKETWDFDVFLYSFRETQDIDLTNIKHLIEARTMGSNLYEEYL